MNVLGDRDQINNFLHFGYLPNPQEVNVNELLSPDGINFKECKNKKSVEKLILKGSDILNNIFKEIAHNIGAKQVVIPISGGMDSRAILAGMICYLPREQIQTVTLGIPDTYDYEIGQMVAERAKVKNLPLNLNYIEWKEQDLIKYARNFEHPIALVDGFLFSQVFRGFDDEMIFLSGFMGDPIAGSHLGEKDSPNWTQAQNSFIARNNYSRSQRPINPQCLFAEPLIDSNLLSFDEQLDFFIRQRFYIMPLVLLKGYQHISPFLSPAWMEFMINLPRLLREKQMLYKKILMSSYPELFSLSVKNNLGLPLSVSNTRFFFRRVFHKLQTTGKHYLPYVFSKPSPNLNYIDFEKSYREKPDLKALVEKSLEDLQSRKLIENMDIEKVWSEHQNKTKNNSQLISLLFSLEIYFKSRNG